MPEHEQPRGLGWGYVVYQQIAGVIGAFALIAFLGHFIEFDWRGAVHELVGMWDRYVRPAVKLLFDVTMVAFVKWAFGWVIEVPLWVRDYLAAGIALTLADLRLRRFSGETYREVATLEQIGLGIFYTLAWPLHVFILMKGLLTGSFGFGAQASRGTRLYAFLNLSPVLWFALLAVLNEIAAH